MPVRPQKVEFDAGTEGWDGAVRDNFDSILEAPFPIFRVVTAATLTSAYAADEYEECIALAQDTGAIYLSDGTTWNRLVPQMPYDGSPTATTLRDALVTSGLMAPS